MALTCSEITLSSGRSTKRKISLCTRSKVNQPPSSYQVLLWGTRMSCRRGVGSLQPILSWKAPSREGSSFTLNWRKFRNKIRLVSSKLSLSLRRSLNQSQSNTNQPSRYSLSDCTWLSKRQTVTVVMQEITWLMAKVFPNSRPNWHMLHLQMSEIHNSSVGLVVTAATSSAILRRLRRATGHQVLFRRIPELSEI